jgi:hypothetical protein
MSKSSIHHESEVDDYVYRYHILRKKSFDSIIELAKLVVDAEIKLEHRFETFLGLIELDRKSSTYRKYIAIAKAAPRLELYRDTLPPCWTTLYAIANLDLAVFEQIKSSFHPNLTAKQLALAIDELKPPQQIAAQLVSQTHADPDKLVEPSKPVERPTPDAFNEPDEEPKIVISLKKLSHEQRQRLREQLAQLRATFLFEMIESTTAERVLADVA